MPCIKFYHDIGHIQNPMSNGEEDKFLNTSNPSQKQQFWKKHYQSSSKSFSLIFCSNTYTALSEEVISLQQIILSPLR